MPVASYVFAVLIITLLAAGVVAVVAISSGNWKTSRPRLQALAERTEEMLEGSAEPPAFLEKLNR